MLALGARMGTSVRAPAPRDDVLGKAQGALANWSRGAMVPAARTMAYDNALDDTTSANAGRRGCYRRLTAAAATQHQLRHCSSAMALPVPTVAPTSTPSVAMTSLGSGDQPHGGGDVVRHGREGARRDVLHQR